MASDIKIVAEIGLLIYPGAQLAAVYGLTDLFRIAGEWATPLEGGQQPTIRVTHWQSGAHAGMDCVWDSHPGGTHSLSHVIAPPSIIMPDKMPSMQEPAAWLSDQHRAGATICAICAGAFVLAETGLINGRRATTHWAFAHALADRFPKVEVAIERMVIDDGDIMTAGGILAWTDLGLTLVEKLMGPSTMLATARFLLIEPPGRQQRAFAQFIPRFDHGDAAILRAQHHLHATRAQTYDLAELSAISGLEQRTLLRRFRKATGLRPTEYAQEVRIAKAREQLEATNQPVEQIAWQVGYSDPAAFRKVFQRITGLGPATYRQRFGVA
ncbi:MAG: GlxA family transcriptional regulator [Alphaproteobacteria bacterium]|nr:GlxA family transcriptional regulator [Alphaproteobacteria bacterium]MBU0796022.1 GlxA family transcriptional regulator [Alphaproteobacteria bacterium]MBU0886843.1 GlxA family transcriptional regulator [Alphaproteobacteria bacterium]MBU1812415.1 GlxA family transcriptional regulator [Alphaproteobacteria bacterium]MBU2089381.1 GlxA family transcriptional regulator [Alphaproteobacteria bacterium]